MAAPVTSGDASYDDGLEQLDAREDAGEDHWVSSEVQGELWNSSSRRNGLGVERDDELELVTIRRRCTVVDLRFVDQDGDLDLPRVKKPRRTSSSSRRSEQRKHSGDQSSEETDRGCETLRRCGGIETFKLGSECVGVATDHRRREELDSLQVLVRSRTSWRVAGAQIWRAALLLAEFIDAKPELFTDATVLELGCGVGLASIVAARTARHVFATDGDAQALVLAQKNVTRNCRWSDSEDTAERQSIGNGPRCGLDDQTIDASTTTAGRANLAVSCIPQLRVFDWANIVLPWCATFTNEGAASSHPPPTDFTWMQDDANALAQLSIIIASDVLYDEETSLAFMSAVRRVLLRSTQDVTVVVALERRPVFSASTMSIVSLGYDAFHAQLCSHNGGQDHVYVSANRVKCHQCTSDAASTSLWSSLQQEGGRAVAPIRFVARECPVGDIPHVFDYDRPSTLMLWIIDAVIVE